MLPLRVDLLDCRSSVESKADPLFDSVAIPFEELVDRQHELPRPDKPLRIYGPPLGQPVLLDRPFEAIDDPERGTPGRCRLWDYNPLLDALGNPGFALDLGCGAGRDAIALACLGWRVTACDNLASSIQRARQMEAIYSDGAPVDWRILDLRREIPDNGSDGEGDTRTGAKREPQATEGDSLEELRLALRADAPPSFDLITAFFFWKEEPVLHAAHELLKPGGLLAVQMFTPTDQARHGKPKHVVDKAGLQKLFPTYEPLRLQEAWENDRHTVRAILKKPE